MWIALKTGVDTGSLISLKERKGIKVLRAEVIVRESWRVDDGTMGFHDYVTHKENFSDFVDRVLREANTHWKDGKCSICRRR